MRVGMRRPQNWSPVSIGRLDQEVMPELGDATDYDAVVSYRIRRAQRYIQGRWLDYGCANGGYDPALLRAGATEVVGIDVEPFRLNHARSRGIPSTSYYVCEGELPFDDGSFDGVWMNEVLEHVPDERLVLAEAWRVLRTGGGHPQLPEQVVPLRGPRDPCPRPPCPRSKPSRALASSNAKRPDHAGAQLLATRTG